MYLICIPGYRGTGGAEGEPGSQGGKRGHVRELRRLAAEVSPGLGLLKTWYFFVMCLVQTLSGISAEKNSTVIFPIPIDMIKKYLN